MLCQCCHKKEACLHATKIENREVKHLHLCEDCARAAGFDMETGMVDLQKLTQRWAAAAALRRRPEAEGVTGVCPQCGTESNEVNGKHPAAGCPRCYEVFPEELQRALREAQGGLRVPPRWASEAEARQAALEAARASASLLRGLADEATGEDPAFVAAGMPKRSGVPAGEARPPAARESAAQASEAPDAPPEAPAARHEEHHREGRRGAARRSGARSAREERRRLEAALEEAVRAENYEEAAKLRDRLKELEGGAE